MLRSGYCLSSPARRALRSSLVDRDTACACAHSQDSARSGNSLATCAAVSVIEGSGWPAFDPRQARRNRAVDHHQHQPGAQMIARSAIAGRQQPGKIRRVEIDDRQIIRLEVGDVGLGVGAHHQARVDADDVARPVQAQVDVARYGGCRVAVLLGLQGQADGDLGLRLQRGVGAVRVLVRARKSAPCPGHETIGNAHAVNSAISAT